jgi:hypothetical protein
MREVDLRPELPRGKRTARAETKTAEIIAIYLRKRRITP